MNRKKLRRILWLAALVFVICFAAVKIANYKVQEQARMEAVAGLREDIKYILAIFATEQTDGETLNALAGAFDRLHWDLRNYVIGFPERGRSANSYSGSPSFDFIASTLRGGGGNGYGEINGNAYHCLQSDGVISDRELEYLARLREGMENLDLLMNYKEYITTQQVLDFVYELLTGWHLGYSDSPYYLLFTEG